MFLSNRGSFRPETSGAYTLRRRGRRRPKSGSAIGACAVARLAGSGGPIGDYYGSANSSLKRPVHFLLDEFGNIGTVPDFERVIATARSRNVSFSIILQSASQLERAYKKEGAKTILDCCDTVVFLGGKSTETNEMISKMVGKQTVKVLTESDSRGANRSTTQNYNVIERDLMTPDEVGRLPRDESIVLISGTYPLKGAKYRIEEHPSYPEVDPGHAGARHEERFDFKEYRERRGGDAPMR